MQVGTTLHGFSVERTERIEELNADASILRHIETGAQLMLIPNDDDNKVFKISFPTHPSDDTGVAHILEHSVLNGSKKYPLREPFAELAKGSLCTFLNAFTYPDRTCYPVASCNHDDFANLVDVYLDAVFNPLLSENTFAQEGWHYDLQNTDGPLTVTGVVYNEMHGAYADPESTLDRDMDRAFFPESLYGLDSGGDPAIIPNLTYEQFCDFHSTFYHPSNGFIFLYGDLDTDRVLKQIDGFIAGRGKSTAFKAPARQPRFDAPRNFRATYSAEPGTTPEESTFLYRNWLLKADCSPLDDLSLTMLFRILTGRPSSPLRKALIESHLGADTIGGGFESELFETAFGIGLKDSSPDKQEAFNAVIDETLESLIRDGLDSEAVEAVINATEFSLREANFGGYPKGLIYALSALAPAIYGGDPFAPLRYEQHLAEIRAGVAEGRYFENLMQTWLIDNPHQLHVIYEPEPEKSEKVAADLATELADQLGKMTDAEKASQIAFCQQLQEAQDQPDTEAALATLPQLPLSALDKKAKDYPFELINDTAGGFSWADQPTAGISYIRAAFSTDAVSAEQLPLLPFFGKACMQTGTAKRDYVALAQAIDLHTGGLSAYAQCRSKSGNPQVAPGTLVFAGKALTSKADKLIDLLCEIWSSARFDDAARLLDIARASLTRLERSMPSSGHTVVRRRLGATLSRAGAQAELFAGVSQHRYLKELVARLETAPESVMAELENLRRTVLTSNGLHLHITGAAAERQTWQSASAQLRADLPSGSTPASQPTLPKPATGEAFSIPANTHYVGLGVNLFDLGWQPHGAFAILETLVARDYLWNRVRVKGGAYGCFMQTNPLSGASFMISYRDPNVAETYTAYREIGDYLKNLDLSRREFEKLIIGTIGSADNPRTPEQAGDLAYDRFVTGLATEEIQQRRDELLASDVDQIRDYAELLTKYAESATTCAVGTAAQLETNTEEFSSITPLIP